ncbi:hypothetical protein MKX08_007728, partial [Trichoderma sp. CBMAI-0020]
LRDNTNEVDSVVFKGLGNVPRGVDSYNDTEKLRNTSGEVTSKTNTINLYTNILKGLCKTDANIIITYLKKDTLFLPSYRILILSAISINKGWRLTFKQLKKTLI